LLCEKSVELYECRYAHPWRTHLHRPANHRVEHPCRHHDHVTGCRLNTDDGLVVTALAIIPPYTSAIERVPTVMNLYFWPDMGRMTVR
jgi:hypothetical protein